MILFASNVIQWFIPIENFQEKFSFRDFRPESTVKSRLHHWCKILRQEVKEIFYFMFQWSFFVRCNRSRGSPMSACPLLDRVTMISTTLPQSAPDHLVRFKKLLIKLKCSNMFQHIFNCLEYILVWISIVLNCILIPNSHLTSEILLKTNFNIN